jgi:hypothetical protein
MPRFYFHIREGDLFEHDIEGVELSSAEEARREAEDSAREMVAEAVLRSEVIDGRLFEVTSEDGSVVATVPFASVIRL